MVLDSKAGTEVVLQVEILDPSYICESPIQCAQKPFNSSFATLHILLSLPLKCALVHKGNLWAT